MPQVHIKRSSEYLNAARRIKIEVDGQTVAALPFGKRKSLELEAGLREVRAKIDWCSSQTLLLELQEDSEVHLELKGFKGAAYLLPLGLLGGILASFAEEWNFPIWTFPLLLSPFFVFIYYFSFGRHKYLRLHTVSKSPA